MERYNDFVNSPDLNAPSFSPVEVGGPCEVGWGGGVGCGQRPGDSLIAAVVSVQAVNLPWGPTAPLTASTGSGGCWERTRVG